MLVGTDDLNFDTMVLFYFFVLFSYLTAKEIGVSGKKTNGNSLKNLPYRNTYGEEYGVEWIFFPDGDELSHFVNLSVPKNIGRTGNVFDIEYRLYTRFGNDDYDLFDESANSFTEFNLKRFQDLPLKVITHGWRSSADKNAVINIKNAYLSAQNVNVIGVDWSSTADSYVYPIVALQTKVVGAQIAHFLESLHTLYNISGDQMHLIGHSLGAHVMGIAAAQTNFPIGRVTGLDPARPMFEFPSTSDSSRLDSSDAKFVDIIHTCGGILGVEKSSGHIDFYPNNGAAPQPGCSGVQYVFEACSHSRAHYYFADSIKDPTAYPACQSKSWSDYLNNSCNGHTFMGDGVNRNLSGEFFLRTDPQRLTDMP